jgi:hypothetical protein
MQPNKPRILSTETTRKDIENPRKKRSRRSRYVLKMWWDSKERAIYEATSLSRDCYLRAPAKERILTTMK